MPRYKKVDITKVKQFRTALGENQQEFWSRFGVTQSGGSRYERDARRIPTPVAMLVGMFLTQKVDDGTLRTALKSVGRFRDE